METAGPVFWVTMGVAFVASMPVADWLRRTLRDGTRLHRMLEPAGYALSAVLFALCILAMSASTYNPFIYFRF
jgi:alginate O-acetyltransferase complex protein AlgI